VTATPSQRLDAATVERVKQALLVFAACARDIRTDEPDDDYAKFRLLASDYRRAHKLFVDLFGEEPPFPEDAHAALATEPHQHGGKGA
jgi:hypothetical protein